MLNGPKVNAFFFFFACNDMICMYMIYSLVETSITIGEQQFCSDANSEEIFLFFVTAKGTCRFWTLKQLEKNTSITKAVSLAFGKNQSREIDNE